MDLNEQDTGVDEGVSEQEIAQDTIADTDVARKPDQEPVRLEELEEFRNYQKSNDKQKAELKRQNELLQQQLAARQASEEQATLATLDDTERERFLREKAEREAEEARRYAREIENQTFFERQMAEIIAETGAPREAIDISSPHAAWKSAYQYQKEQAAAPAQEAREAQEAEAKQTRNSPHVGSGRAPTQTNARKKRIAEAKRSGVMSEIYKAYKEPL